MVYNVTIRDDGEGKRVERFTEHFEPGDPNAPALPCCKYIGIATLLINSPTGQVSSNTIRFDLPKANNFEEAFQQFDLGLKDGLKQAFGRKLVIPTPQGFGGIKQ